MSQLLNPHIVEQETTCEACPVQLEGRLDDGRYFYFRYRWGRAALGVGETPQAAVNEQRGGCGEYMEHGDSLQGVFESDEDLNEVFDQVLRWRRIRDAPPRAMACQGCGATTLFTEDQDPRTVWCVGCRAD